MIPRLSRRDRAAQEIAQIRAILRRLPLPSSAPEWLPVREILGPDGLASQALARTSEEPTEQELAALVWIRERAAWVCRTLGACG